jgi:hypothetical protein
LEQNNKKADVSNDSLRLFLLRTTTIVGILAKED